ncbi:hypothetical protein J4573_35820 [Actinomadura barringtoniae]|uniref:DUF485 domain-containing protein n=1 Tax=Actinomadura barringtoniae TaxID=1427535 RepID=A0A939PPV6_9ACTN|nr:hypothetical protein [Actinomadura barringtoniae]MBO2452506.1 hypothetical protein [Actinomadura barringtoniae]
MSDARTAVGNAARRVVVANPRTRWARSAASSAMPDCGREARWTMAQELDEHTELGAVFVRSLIRAQLRTALLTLAIVTAVVIGLPLLLMTMPALCRSRLYGVPLPWLGLALFVQPLWIAAAARHLRQAERTEREFARLVDRS